MIIYCVAGIGAFFLYISVVSYALSAAVNRKSGDPAVRALSATLFVRHVGVSWLSMLIMCYAQIRHWAGAVLRRRSGPATDTRAAPSWTVIFLHGAYHNASAWHFIKPRVLGFLGRARGYCFCYSVGKKDLDALSRELELFIRECVQDSDASKVILIGHSLGGLIARHYRSTRARGERMPGVRAPGQLGGIITLSTPHAGTVFATCGLDPLSRSLYPGSPVFQSLEAREEALAARSATPPDCYALHPILDNMVLPAYCLRVRSPGWRSRELPGLSHLALLWHARALRAVLDALSDLCLDERGMSDPAAVSLQRALNRPGRPQAVKAHMENLAGVPEGAYPAKEAQPAHPVGGAVEKIVLQNQGKLRTKSPDVLKPLRPPLKRGRAF